jgi:type II secretory pathway pseudopilin PulG
MRIVLDYFMSHSSRGSRAPAPSPLSQAVHRQVHGRDIPPPSQAGFSFVEVILGVAVVSILGVGAFTLANRLEEKKEIRIEQNNVQEIAQRVGSAYSSVGRFPGTLRQSAIGDGLLPSDMVRGTQLQNVWGSSVDLRTTTIDGKADAGMEIVYASVPKSGCAPLAISAGSGMFDVEIDGVSVMDAEGNVDPLAAGARCNAPAAEVVFTYTRALLAWRSLRRLRCVQRILPIPCVSHPQHQRPPRRHRAHRPLARRHRHFARRQVLR